MRGTSAYPLEDIRKILPVALLIETGHRISKTALFSHEERLQKLQEMSRAYCHQQLTVHQLLLDIYSVNSNCFETKLGKGFVNWPAQDVLQGFIILLLKKAALLRQGNCLLEEQLVVTIPRQKLLHAINGLIAPRRREKDNRAFLGR